MVLLCNKETIFVDSARILPVQTLHDITRVLPRSVEYGAARESGCHPVNELFFASRNKGFIFQVL